MPWRRPFLIRCCAGCNAISSLPRQETGYCGFGDSCKFMHDRGVRSADLSFPPFPLIVHPACLTYILIIC